MLKCYCTAIASHFNAKLVKENTTLDSAKLYVINNKTKNNTDKPLPMGTTNDHYLAAY